MKRYPRFAEIFHSSWHVCACLLGGFVLILSSAVPCLSVQTQEEKDDRIRTELLYKGDKIIILSDNQEWLSETHYRAEGNVKISYKDIVMVGDRIEFHRKSGQGTVSGNVRFTRKEEWLSCSSA